MATKPLSGPHAELAPGRIAAIMDTSGLATLLRDLRRRQARQRGDAELTYRALAARTGWSTGILTGYFTGRILPPTDRFDTLVALLDATPAEQGALATARDRVQELRRRAAPAGRPGRQPTGRPARAPATDRPVPRQLPGDGCRFAGRAEHLAMLDALLDRDGPAPPAQVAVLSGTAGAGKTALAVHWAHRASARFPDGQLYVNLRGFDAAAAPMSPGEAVRGFLDAFGVTAARVPAGLAAQAALYRSLLAERRVLVVLDNAHDADQVRPLLPGSATCRTVVTSRNALSGLVAVEGAQPIGVGLLSMGEARLLLAYRIGPHRLRGEPAAADDIINRCARLPLALAIAAARASARPGTALRLLADELDAAGDGLAAFTGEDAAGDARTAFRCSYHHLSAPAATLFRLLGLHPGPDVGTAAAASLAGWPVAAVRPVLMELTGAHLLTEHRPGRYAAHDLLRAYAIEQARLLDPGTERRSAVHRLLDHYLHAARAAAMLLYPHRDPVTVPAPRPGVTRAEPADAAAARAWFQAEHPVLTRLVRLAADGFGTHAWQLAWALGDFLDWCGHWHDLAATQTDALAAAAALGDRPGEGHARRNLARAFIRLGRYAGARSLLDEAVVLSAGAGDLIGQAHSRLDLALVEERGGAHRPALQHARRALDLFSAAGHRIGQARALNAVGWYHTLLGDHDEAVTCIERALALHLVLGNRLGQAATWDSLGFAQHQLGEHGRAAASYGRAVSLFREAGDRFHEADTLIHLGDTHEVAGAPDLARATWRRALGLLEDLRHPAAAELRPRLAR